MGRVASTSAADGIAGGALLSRLARKRGWSHVHVHSCAESANIALFAHRLSGLPYSMTLHGPLSDYGKNQKQKWRHASFAIVITKKLLAEVNEQVGESLPEVVEIAPMGVELHKFNRSTPYQPFPASDGAEIVAVGNDGQFRALCRALGAPEMGEDPRFASNAGNFCKSAIVSIS